MSLRKLIANVFVLLGVLTVAFGVGGARQAEAQELTDVVLTNVYITDSSGDLVDEDTVVGRWSRLTLSLDWDATSYGNTIHAGDTFTIGLPEQMSFYTNAASTNFDLYNANNVAVASAVVDVTSGGGGTITVTFNDAVEGLYDVKGTISLNYTNNKIVVDTVNTYDIAVNGNIVYTVKSTVGSPGEMNPNAVSKYGSLQTITLEDGSTMQAVRWLMRINFTPQHSQEDVTIDDTVSYDGSTVSPSYVTDRANGSFVLQRVEFSADGSITKYYEDEIYDVSEYVTITDVTDESGAVTGQNFVLNLTEASGINVLDTNQYVLYYWTSYIPGMKIRNVATLTSGEIEETRSASYTSASGSGTASGQISRILVQKVDADDETITLAGARFVITSVATGESFEVITGEDGTFLTDTLTPGDYTIQEIEAPEGYYLDSTVYELTVLSDALTMHAATDRKIPTTSVTVTKVWEGDATESVTVHLLANGTEVDSATITAADNWTHTFSDLYATDDNGEKIVYTVTEDEVEGYTTEISGDAESGFVITNTKKPDTPTPTPETPTTTTTTTKTTLPATGDAGAITAVIGLALGTGTVAASRLIRGRDSE